MNNAEKWNRFREAAAKLTWAYLATNEKQQPHVRVVHPAFEGEKVWIATGRKSPKARQIEANPRVELFYSVGEQFTHLTVTGSARFIDDLDEKKRVWNGKVFDYELGQFWPAGPQAPDFGLILMTPSRIELTSLPEMTTGKKPLVWKAD
jgi:general stress protein 26